MENGLKINSMKPVKDKSQQKFLKKEALIWQKYYCSWENRIDHFISKNSHKKSNK